MFDGTHIIKSPRPTNGFYHFQDGPQLEAKGKSWAQRPDPKKRTMMLVDLAIKLGDVVRANVGIHFLYSI